MAWKRWTAREDAYLRSRYGRAPTKLVARDIGRTVAAVHSRAGHLEVKCQYRTWSPERESLLRKKYGRIPTNRLARELGMSLPAVYTRAKRLDITRNIARAGISRAWTTSEDNFLNENYGKTRPSAIAKALGRSKASIYHRSMHLHLASVLGSPEFSKRQSLPRTAQAFTGTTEPAVLGYVAGIIDGEGSITMPPTLAISVTTTTRILAVRLQAMVGGSITGPYLYQKTKVFGTRRCSVKPQYHWGITSRYHLYQLLKALLPYLVLKDGKAKQAISYLERKYRWGTR